MITAPTIQGALTDRAQNNIFEICGSGVPTNGAAGSGVGISGPGDLYFDYTNGALYINIGTLASPTWQVVSGLNAFRQATGTIVTGDITGTSAGQFGHANGYPLVAGQGTHFVIELISVIMNYKFLTAAYTGGGNVTVNNSAGGTALTGLVSNANSMTAASSKSVMFVPLTTVGIPLVENGGLNLVAASAFTQPGTAAGTIAYVVNYRVHATGF